MMVDKYGMEQSLWQRRQFLTRTSLGLGALALGQLASPGLMAKSRASEGNGLPDLPHFPAKVKRVIYLFQSGGLPTGSL